MKEKSGYKVVSRRLKLEAIDAIDEIADVIKEIKKKKGDRSRILIQEIDSECVILGAKVLKEKLKKHE